MYTLQLQCLVNVKRGSCPGPCLWGSAGPLSPGQTIATCQHNISQHCCDMLGVVGSNLTSFKLEPITPNVRNTVAKRTQHVAPNNVAICCDRLAGALGSITSHCLGNELVLLSRRHGWTCEDSFVSLSQSDNRLYERTSKTIKIESLKVHNEKR